MDQIQFRSPAVERSRMDDRSHRPTDGEVRGKITIRRPDDWHVHLRDGDMLARVAPFTALQFARAI